MARTISADGNCYREVVVYTSYIDNHQELKTNYFGPYDEPSKARARATAWMGGKHRFGENTGHDGGRMLVERYTEKTSGWHRV